MTLSFQDLSWHTISGSWRGKIDFHGQFLPVSIDFDTDEEKEMEHDGAKKAAAKLLIRLTPEWESISRMKAAELLLTDYYSQSSHKVAQEEIEQLYEDMTMVSINFCHGVLDKVVTGVFLYFAPKFFPDMKLQINFLDDLTIDEVMAYDV